ncbi:MAG TPA: Cof-type HAD-IIB family hydrolase [Candidatus Angelobacter sp.]|jgi:Cof subfamily protein (haloacid dehalogenase superfamily)|nr:Cof-type HAD-IIB family hydrolase [Candidatus Angelobacter sp.]
MTDATNRVTLVISDVDGTLLDDAKQLTPGAPAAVQRLYAAGIRFTLASARPPLMVKWLIDRLAVREPYACFNGALVVSPQGQVLRKIPMLRTDAQLVADRIVQDGFDLWVWTDTDWYVINDSGPHVAHHVEGMGRKPTLLTSHDMSQFDVLKLVGVSENYDALARAETEMATLGCQSISATRSSPYYLDVTEAHANKGAVVTTLSELLQIPAARIATIGDMITDTLMFRKSGVSIAMGNAFDDVKALATDVTTSNQEDGFAYAMDHFILSTAG